MRLDLDARNSMPRVVVITVIMLGICLPAFTVPIRVYHDDFDLPVPATGEPEGKWGKGWMTDAIIEVPDHITIYDIDVGINLTHTNVFDLQIFLQSPSGRRLLLNMYGFRKEFFDGEDYRQTIFDDEAEIPIEDADAPFTGRFRPRAGSFLNVFDGEDAFGQWRLQIHDRFYDDIGELESFELIITTPEPATAILFALGVSLMCLHKSHCTRKNRCKLVK